MSGAITVLIDDPSWRKPRGLSTRLRQAAEAALRASGFKGKSGLTVLLASDARLEELNRDFRGKNKPTNVLSFPAAENPGSVKGRTAGRKTAARPKGRSVPFLADAPVYRGDVAPLIDGTKASSVEHAALIHATAGHALDYDDVQLETVSHPSVPVVPALLLSCHVILAGAAETGGTFRLCQYPPSPKRTP